MTELKCRKSSLWKPSVVLLGSSCGDFGDILAVFKAKAWKWRKHTKTIGFCRCLAPQVGQDDAELSQVGVKASPI